MVIWFAVEWRARRFHHRASSRCLVPNAVRLFRVTVGVGYLVLLVSGRILLVGGVIRRGGLGQCCGGQGAAKGRSARAATATAATPVHLAAFRQRHVRTYITINI